MKTTAKLEQKALFVKGGVNLFKQIYIYIKFPVFVCMDKNTSLSFQQFRSCEDQLHLQFKVTCYAALL